MSEYRGIEVFGRQRRRRATVPAPQGRPRWLLGVLAFTAGILTAGCTTTGILLAMGGRFEGSILIAYLATGISVVAVLCGAAAVVTGRGRGWGAVAIVVGILSSPPLLTRLLDWASGLG
ncbi:MAG TPA: hypothetical protein VGF80_07455 [Galbitalea sp.]|jgi:hypothetical protein